MADDPKIDTLMPSDGDHEKMFELVNALQLATSARYPDPADAMAMGMTAGAIFAGMQFGYALAAGIERSDKARQKQIMLVTMTNFQAGMKVALNKSARVGGEGPVQ